MEDHSKLLQDTKLFTRCRSIGHFRCQERYDVAFVVKELAVKASNPTSSLDRMLVPEGRRATVW